MTVLDDRIINRLSKNNKKMKSRIDALKSEKAELIELLKKIDEDVLLPYEHSYYKNKIQELIK